MLPGGDALKVALLLRAVYALAGILFAIMTLAGGAALYVWKDLTGKVERYQSELAKAKVTIELLEQELKEQRALNERLKRYLQTCVLGSANALLEAPQSPEEGENLSEWERELLEFAKRHGLKIRLVKPVLGNETGVSENDAKDAKNP